jgi:hypothetical protein
LLMKRRRVVCVNRIRRNPADARKGEKMNLKGNVMSTPSAKSAARSYRAAPLHCHAQKTLCATACSTLLSPAWKTAVNLNVKSEPAGWIKAQTTKIYIKSRTAKYVRLCLRPG